MMNEILLAFSLLAIYSTVLFAYRALGKTGLYVWIAIATIAANIEVILLIKAFGLEQTLGNILFASTFLVTDILSENEGQKAAKKAVFAGIFANIVFILISQSWFLYTPSESDWAMKSVREVFTNVPRIMFVGISVYAISQLFDVWLYEKIWKSTRRIFKNDSRGLWIRNNISTMLSQIVNTILFTFGAFYGIEGYDVSTIWTLVFSSYVIYIVTSICDTPAVYVARKIKKASLKTV